MSEQAFSSATGLGQNQELRFLHITDKGMAFDPKTGDSYQLNTSALFILGQLQAGKNQTEMAAALAEKFKLAPEQALTDVLEFSIQLKILNLLT